MFRIYKASSFWNVPKIALPLILSNLTVPLLGLANTIVAGHLAAAYLLAAVGFGVGVFDFIYWCFGFLRQATTGFVAQALGRGDTAEAVCIFERGLFLSLVIAAFLWCMQKVIVYGLHFVLPADALLRHAVAIYVSTRIWGAPFTLANYVFNAWFLAVKRTRCCLLLMFVMNGVAIVAAISFVWCLHWGIRGLAMADICGQASGFFLGVVLCCKDERISKYWSWFIWRWQRFKEMMSMNRDLFIRTFSLMSAFFFFNIQSAHLGTVTLAANTVLLNMMMLMSYAQDGFNSTAEILVANSLGAKDIKLFWEGLFETLVWSLIISIVFALLFFLFGDFLITKMTSLTKVQVLAGASLIWVVVQPLLSVWCFWLDGVFMGALWGAEIRNAMVLSLIGFFVAWLITRSWGITGLWVAFLSFFVWRGVSLLLYFNRRRVGGNLLPS